MSNKKQPFCEINTMVWRWLAAWVKTTLHREMKDIRTAKMMHKMVVPALWYGVRKPLT
jgi:hypothetical protein